MKKTDKLKPVLCVIMAALSSVALFLSLKPVAVSDNIVLLSRLFYDLRKSFTGNSIAASILFAFLTAFYYKYSFRKKETNQTVWASLISVLFAFFMVAGQSFEVSGSMMILLSGFRIMFKSALAFVGFVILFYNLSNFVIDIFLKPTKAEGKSKFPQWSVRSFFACTGIIIVCWLGYLAVFYPGTTSPDVSYQIMELYGVPDLFYNMSEVKVSDTIFLTNHQPIAHTVVIGVFMKLGELLGSQNVGLFIYNILQVIATSMTFAFTVCYLAKRGVSKGYLKAMLVIYAIVPTFPLIAINLSKNTLNAYWFLLYVICFFQYVDEPEKTKQSFGWNFLLSASVVCQILFLKTGVFVVLASGLYLIIQQRKQWKTLVPIVLIPVILFMTVYTNILLPACGVSPGSKNEMLSIPIQQTARFVRDYPDEVTPEEKELLSRMFIYDKLPEEYNPEKVDPVKWHAYKVDNDVPLKDYLEVWFNQFLRHPMCYVEATANNVFSYFYPGNRTIYTYYEFDDSCKDVRELDGIVDVGNPASLDAERDCVRNAVESIKRTSVGFIFSNGANYILVCMFMCAVLLSAKKYKYLAVMTPTAVSALFCVLSPMNANARYFIPMIYASLFSVGMTLYACKSDSEKNHAI